MKLHGDYLDTRIKNTDEELGAYSSGIDGLLDRIFDDHGLIACGWSGEWDHALRAAIIRAPNRRFPTFWAARGAIPTRAEDLIKQRGAKVVPITDADSFFADLEQKVATQVEMQQPNPRSIELMIATVKRQISRPELRIQLNDLLADESRRLAQNRRRFPYTRRHGDERRLQGAGRTLRSRDGAADAHVWNHRPLGRRS